MGDSFNHSSGSIPLVGTAKAPRPLPASERKGIPKRNHSSKSSKFFINCSDKSSICCGLSSVPSASIKLPFVFAIR